MDSTCFREKGTMPLARIPHSTKWQVPLQGQELIARHEATSESNHHLNIPTFQRSESKWRSEWSDDVRKWWSNWLPMADVRFCWRSGMLTKIPLPVPRWPDVPERAPGSPQRQSSQALPGRSSTWDSMAKWYFLRSLPWQVNRTKTSKNSTQTVNCGQR